VDEAALGRFTSLLSESCEGSLQRVALVYLRTYESIRQVPHSATKQEAAQGEIPARQRFSTHRVVFGLFS
jgi:hypothetical protein